MRGEGRNERQTSIKERVLSWFGIKLVPERQLQVIERDGRFQRIQGPGYHLPLRWSENYGRRLSLDPRAATFDFENVRSLDGVPFAVEARVLYSFDPRHCASREMMAALSAGDAERRDRLVGHHLGSILRRELGASRASRLAGGAIVGTLETRLRRSLQAVMRPYGFRLVGSAPISVISMSPPEMLDGATQSALGWLRSAEGLRGLSQEQIVHLFWAELVKQMDKTGNRLHLFADATATHPPPRRAADVPPPVFYGNGYHRPGNGTNGSSHKPPFIDLPQQRFYSRGK